MFVFKNTFPFKPKINEKKLYFFQPDSDKGDTTTFYQWIVFVLVISGGKFKTNDQKIFKNCKDFVFKKKKSNDFVFFKKLVLL